MARSLRLEFEGAGENVVNAPPARKSRERSHGAFRGAGPSERCAGAGDSGIDLPHEILAQPGRPLLIPVVGGGQVVRGGKYGGKVCLRLRSRWQESEGHPVAQSWGRR
jgi:hypothetical protein